MFRKKIIQIPPPINTKDRAGWISVVKEAYEEFVEFKSLSYFTDPEKLEAILELMDKYNVTSLQVGEMIVKRRIPDDKLPQKSRGEY